MSTKKYVSDSKLQYFWQKIKEYINNFLTNVDSINVGNLIVNGVARFNNTIYGDLTGTADIAVKDNKGNTISSYVKNLSVNGRTITITKGDNTTSTITTADTSVNSDWAENDSTSKAYVENRTHYVGTPILTEVLNYSNTTNSTYYQIQLTDAEWTKSLYDGLSYTLVLNGNTYTGNMSMFKTVYIMGNKSIIDPEMEDTGESYLLYTAPNYNIAMLMLKEAPTSGVNLSLTLPIPKIYKLDSKYLDGSLITSGEGVYSEIFNGYSSDSTETLYISISGDANATTYTIKIQNSDDRIKYLESVFQKTSITDYDNIKIIDCKIDATCKSGTITLSATLDENNSLKNKSISLKVPYKMASGIFSHAEGGGTRAIGLYSHAEGDNTTASGECSHGEGHNTTADGMYSHTEGGSTTAIGGYSHAEGQGTISSGNSSHAEGNNTTASGNTSHAEGSNTIASGTYSHAEGRTTTASGYYSHAEGQGTKAIGSESHAEGRYTEASGECSHAEGHNTKANGYDSHTEGSSTIASGNASHAEGSNTTASGVFSHSEGNYTIAQRKSQHVFGEYNISDTTGDSVSDRGKYVEIVGNGTSTSNLSNARTLDWSGNETLAGKLTVGSAPVDNMDVATKKYVDDALSNVPTENADWSQNNPTNDSYIKNRTHYTEDPVITEVLTYSSEENNQYYTIAFTETDTEWLDLLKEGIPYTIIYNGTTYTGNITIYDEGGVETYCFGNLAIALPNEKEDTGEPFILAISPSFGGTLMLPEVPTTGVNISLSLSISNIHKLDSKYLDGSLIISGDAKNSEIFNGKPTISTYTISVSGDANATTYTINSNGKLNKLVYIPNYISIVNYENIKINYIGISEDGYSGTLKLTETLDENNSVSEKEFILSVPTKIASGVCSHVEGEGWAIGDCSHTEGLNTIASNSCSHAEGSNTRAIQSCSHAEGGSTIASGSRSHAEGNDTRAIQSYSHAEGNSTRATGIGSHAEGYNTSASGKYSHAENYNTTASGDYSHSEGEKAKATGQGSHAEGYDTSASGKYSHTEGWGTKASEYQSHAEGSGTTASGPISHAEGNGTTASGQSSHAEGGVTTASGKYSHAEGWYTTALGEQSHAEGNSTTAQRRSQHVFGEYNILDNEGSDGTVKGKYIEIVGNGTSISVRSNARTLDWSGNEVLAGKLTVGSAPTNNMDVATKIYVDNISSKRKLYATDDDNGTVTIHFGAIS